MVQHVAWNLPPDHEIILFGDTHEGCILKHKKGVRDVVEYIKNTENCFAVHMGDIVESIAIDDIRYDRKTIDPGSPTPLKQYLNARDELEPIKDKLLVILEGNHDWKVERKHGDFLREIVCEPLGVPYGTFDCWLTAVPGKKPAWRYCKEGDKNNVKYNFFLTHGVGTAKSAAKDPILRLGNRMAAAKWKLHEHASDCVLMAQGHTHRLMVVKPTKTLGMKCVDGQIIQEYYTTSDSLEKIDKDHRWYLHCGSFLKKYGPMGVSGYAERMGLPPAELGFVRVIIKNYKVQDCQEVRV